MVGPPGAERFACSVCGRDFATQQALRIHSNVHVEKNFACTFPGCKKAFAGGGLGSLAGLAVLRRLWRLSVACTAPEQSCLSGC
jgi:hypothetical protein